jgi:hypothetical protein
MLMATAHLSLSINMGAGVLIGVSPACTSAAMAMSVAARVVSERVRSSVLGIVSAAGSLGALLSAPMGRCSTRILAGASACSALWHAFPIVPAAWYAGRIDRIPLPKPSAEQLGNLSAGAAVAKAFSSAVLVAMTCAYFIAACSSSSSPRICRLTCRSGAWSRS